MLIFFSPGLIHLCWWLGMKCPNITRGINQPNETSFSIDCSFGWPDLMLSLLELFLSLHAGLLLTHHEFRQGVWNLVIDLSPGEKGWRAHMQTEPNQNGDITCSPPEVALERSLLVFLPHCCVPSTWVKWTTVHSQDSSAKMPDSEGWHHFNKRFLFQLVMALLYVQTQLSFFSPHRYFSPI